jgi:hypothetical protein
MNKTIEVPILHLVQSGHGVKLFILSENVFFEIDEAMLATANELHQLRDGVFTFEELKDLFVQRKELACRGKL